MRVFTKPEVMLVLPLRFPKPRRPKWERVKVLYWKLEKRVRKAKVDEWAKFDVPTYLRQKAN